AHVLADALHRAAAAAYGLIRLVANVHARQVRGQRTTLRLVPGCSHLFRRLQLGEFHRDRFEIGVDRLVEEAPLRAVQLFAAGGKLPALEHRHLVRELLDLELLVLQLAILAGECFDQVGGELAQLRRIHPRQLIVHLHAFDVATSQCMKTAFSCDTNGCVCADATPWQSDHQRLQLLVADSQSRLGSGVCPYESSLMQSPCAQPDPDPVVQQQLEPIRAAIGEEVSVVRTRLTEYANYPRQCRFRSGAHVHRLDCQPHRVDADHRSSSRSQPAHSAAAANGQSTFTTVAPRRSSIVISCAVVSADLSSWTGMNVRFSTLDRGSAALAISIDLTGVVCSSVTTQRRSRLAFSPLARATAAIDTPGWRQADTTFALNSPLCVRRRRRTMPLSEVSMCPPKNRVDTIILSRSWPSKMTLPAVYIRQA